MAYDEELAARVRDELGGLPGMSEKKMFGGLAFLLDGRMACGVRDEDLMVRLAAEDVDGGLGRPGTRPFEMGGRTSRGWLLVGPEATSGEEELRRWVERGLAHARTLPPK